VPTKFLAQGATIGLPFVMLAATGPLLQVSLARREGGVVPYRLFALSNVGSLLALVLYPTVIEPRLTLVEQRGWWGVGFLVYAAVCGWLGRRAGAVGAAETHVSEARPFDKLRAGYGAPAFVGRMPTHGDDAAMNGAQGLVADEVKAVELRSIPHPAASRRGWGTLMGRGMWFLLPMGAAMQLCAVTSHLSQDVAAIPMLWVLPLGVYLVTFILAFEAPGAYRRWMVVRLLAVMLASLGYALSKVDTALPIRLAVLFYLMEVFVACWFCHAEVYRLRPENPEESTTFYLLVAAGGVAGTFLIAIASPLVFRSNYDLVSAFLVTAVLAAVVTWKDGWAQRLLWVTGSGLLVALTVMLHIGFGRHALMRARNFYGSLRVTEANIDSGADPTGMDAAGNFSSGTGPVRVLMNGRIRHGSQMMDADRRRTPTTYYGQDSGVGVALRSCCVGRTKRVGVVGLGVGTLAAYAHAGDAMRFYEINPLVEPIARNLFTYMRDSPAQITVVEGDGRASLEREPAQGFDVLVVDAFAGDAIPLHLLTREAMLVYRRHLAPGGVVAFHVSNSYVDLAPEIRRLADAVGMRARQVESVAVPAEGEYRASWVLVGGDQFFARPEVAAVSTAIPEQAGLRVWTDDYSSLLAVMVRQ
jgi:spermidine synthase